MYDQELAARVRETLGELTGFDERSMFGGLAFMVNTHLACGVMGEDLMVRVGRDGYEAALARGALELDFTGRPMRGLVTVPGATLVDPSALESWVGTAVDVALAEPPKPARPPGAAGSAKRPPRRWH